MSIFTNKYPYTDFHELNLDWLIKDHKALKDYVYGEHVSFSGDISPVDSIKYGRPIIPDERPFEDLEALTYNDFIDMWDELAEANPQYMTKETWTDDVSGYSNYIYHWEARNIDFVGLNTSGVSFVENFYRMYDMKPGCTIIGAIHGNEKASIWSFYQFFKWCLDPANSVGQWILNNYSFQIAPVVNIYGFNNNVRYNGNGVNLNRNFTYGWETYEGGAPNTDRCKGSAPMSEWETRFCMHIIDSYSNQTRYTFPIFDLHAHHYVIHDDKRVTWYVSNDIEFKEATLFINSWLYEKITERMPELIPDYDNGEVFTRWVASVSTPSFDNEARVRGIRDMALEVPQDFIQGVVYDENTQYIADLIVWNVIVNVLDYLRHCPQGETYYTLYKMGINPQEGYTLEDICDSIPRGSKLVLGIKTDHYMNENNLLPKHNGENIAGLLEFTKSGATEETNVTRLKFTSYGLNYTYTWEASRGASGKLHPWVSKQGTMSGEDIVRYYNYVNEAEETKDTINFTQVVSVVPIDTNCEIYVSANSYPYIYAEIGKGPGILTIKNPYSIGLLRKTAEFVTDDGVLYIAYITGAEIDYYWRRSTSIMSGDEIVEWYNHNNGDSITDETITLEQAITAVRAGNNADIYLSSTHFPQIYSDVGLGIGILSIINPESMGLARKYLQFVTDDDEIWIAFLSSSDYSSIFWRKVGGKYTTHDSGNNNVLTGLFQTMENGDTYSGYFSENEATNRGFTIPTDVSYATYTLTKYVSPSGNTAFGVLICQTVGATLKRFICRIKGDGTQGDWSEIVLS